MGKNNVKVLNFFRKNAAYLVLALCIIAVGLSVTLILLNSPNDDIVVDNVIEMPSDDIIDSTPSDPVIKDNVEEPVSTVKTYILPVVGASTIDGYSTEMVFNETLKRYSSHQAIDFYASEGSKVCAISDGVVENVETTLIYGTTITIDHGNGLKSIYNSLLNGERVSKGQVVKQGDIIGEVSTSNRQEYKKGAHLHFSMTENDKLIDPAKYISIEEK